MWLEVFSPHCATSICAQVAHRGEKQRSLQHGPSFQSPASLIRKHGWAHSAEGWENREGKGEGWCYLTDLTGKLPPFILTSSLSNNACESFIPQYLYSLEHLLLQNASSHFMCSLKVLLLEKRPINLRGLLCNNQYKASELYISENGVFILKCWKGILNQGLCTKGFRHRCQRNHSIAQSVSSFDICCSSSCQGDSCNHTQLPALKNLLSLKPGCSNSTQEANGGACGFSQLCLPDGGVFQQDTWAWLSSHFSVPWSFPGRSCSDKIHYLDAVTHLTTFQIAGWRKEKLAPLSL